MKTPLYLNPYSVVEPDVGESSLSREAILGKLDNFLIYVHEPSCISIVAERGMGGPAIVQRFLRTRADQLRYRVVEFDVKSDLGRGTSSADFYRALVHYVRGHVADLPPLAASVADRLAAEPGSDIVDLVKAFFKALKDPERPLLVVFYSFDRLPGCFPFHDMDWFLLRELNNQVDLRLYYLVVSRRPIRYIEALHHLERSLFSTSFPPPYRVPLLSEREVRSAMNDLTAQAVSQRNPWPHWLIDRVIEWGGRNHYCTEQICFLLFQRWWQDRAQVVEAEAAVLRAEIATALRDYFERLYFNLDQDQLLKPLVQTISNHPRHPSPEVQELCDLGYFLPEPLQEGRYMLFSPLFHDYLAQRGALEPEEEEAAPVPLDVPPMAEPLSRREKEILEILVQRQNATNSDIANHFELTADTIKTHMRNINRKLGVHSRAEARRRAKELRLFRR